MEGVGTQAGFPWSRFTDGGAVPSKCHTGYDAAPSLTMPQVSVSAGRARAHLMPVSSRIQMRSVVPARREHSAAMGNGHGFLATVSHITGPNGCT